MSCLADCLLPLMLHIPVWVEIIELHSVLILQNTGSCQTSCSIISHSRDYFSIQPLSIDWCFLALVFWCGYVSRNKFLAIAGEDFSRRIDNRFSLSHCLPDSIRTPELRRNRGTEFDQRHPFCCFFMYHISVLLFMLAKHGSLVASASAQPGPD